MQLAAPHQAPGGVGRLQRALLREDGGFHAYQMLEAGVRQFAAWGDSDEGRHILIAVTRYLAAHSPTERAVACDVRERQASSSKPSSAQ